MNWQIHPAAQQELDDCLEWFAHIDPELALAFEERYLQARHAICSNPLLYNIRQRGVRRVKLTPRFGEHYIAYTVKNEQLIILAVAHAKRRPHYWRTRLADMKKPS
jgi:plasmid stabilization system protein ParE